MNVPEAARLLEVRPATVYALCRAGLLGHMRIGVGRGTIRIDPADVERYKAEARAKGANPAPSKFALRHVRSAGAAPATVPHVFRHIKPKS